MTKDELLAILIAIWEEGAEDLFPLSSLEDIETVLSAQKTIALEQIRKFLLTIASAEIVDRKWLSGKGLDEFLDGMNLRILQYLYEHIEDENLKEEIIFYETWNGERIVNTEETRCTSEAFLEDHDEYVYHSMHDDRVCGECLELDGRTFKKEDALVGVNYPPMHANCRCFISES